MAVWPSGLPQYFLTEGFVMAVPDGRIRSQTDTGPGKVRRRSTALAVPVKGRMLMDADQVADMEAWIESDLFGGVEVFDFPHPITRAVVPCRIAETMPIYSHVGGDVFNVALELEILPH